MSDEYEVVKMTTARRDLIIDHIRNYSVDMEKEFSDFIEILHLNCGTLREFECRRNLFLRDWAEEHNI
ncbi:hypothetical protein D3C85_14660 [compost metagenome]